MAISHEVLSQKGKVESKVSLDENWFGIAPNVAVMHQVVTAQLAARRSGTQSTKTRSEVRGGGAKPWRQKGTGRARQGSIRSPQWVGGGVALGPKPRSYAQRTPKKMINLALRSALSDRLSEDSLKVISAWSFDEPKTKDAIETLKALSLDDKKVLIVCGPDDENAALSFRNLSNIQLIDAEELNAYDILSNDVVVFTLATIPGATVEEAKRPKRSSKKVEPKAETDKSEADTPEALAQDAGDLEGAEEADQNEENE